LNIEKYSGGKKIPDLVRINVEKRINDVAEQQLKGKFVRLELSFKGQFCYIDAFTEPDVDENWNEISGFFCVLLIFPRS
jgi:hypothetical protein